MTPRKLSRRRFLGASAAGGAAAVGFTPLAGCSDAELTAVTPEAQEEEPIDPADELRVAVVGTGHRGQDHLKTLGYLDPESALADRKELKYGRIPGVRCVAVCDPFDGNRREGARQVTAIHGECAEYLDYREMLEKEDLDGVVIATPDHLHAPIAIAAAEAGADSYVEKCITNNMEETLLLGEALKKHGRILQNGFQTTQDHMHKLAANVVRDGRIGDVTMVEYFFHRGGEAGAWVFPEEKNGGPPREEIHWEHFLGDAPKVDYSPKRYFGWRCFWDYSTGISGDILSHAINAVEQVVGVGIPNSVTASGGVYHWKDGRETPDQFNVIFEYEEREVSVVFQSSLQNSFPKQATRFLGTDGTIELDWRLRVYADRWSDHYAKRIQSGAINPLKPVIDMEDSAAGMAVRAAPSELWLGGRGATLTTREDGKVADTTRLHHENFWRCVRTREEPDGGFEASMPATIAAHMATVSYREGRRVRWDAENMRIV